MLHACETCYADYTYGSHPVNANASKDCGHSFRQHLTIIQIKYLLLITAFISKSRKLSSTKDRGLGCRLGLGLNVTFNPRRAMVMTHPHAQDQRSVSLKNRVETDGRMEATALSLGLMWSVMIVTNIHMEMQGYCYSLIKTSNVLSHQLNVKPPHRNRVQCPSTAPHTCIVHYSHVCSC